MSSTWSGSITLGPDQVGIAYTEVSVVAPSTVAFTLTVDEPAISTSFTWDGQDITHSGVVPDQVIGVELLNMTLPSGDRCGVWVKFVSETTVTSHATWSIVSGDGVLEYSALTV